MLFKRALTTISLGFYFCILYILPDTSDLTSQFSHRRHRSCFLFLPLFCVEKKWHCFNALVWIEQNNAWSLGGVRFYWFFFCQCIYANWHLNKCKFSTLNSQIQNTNISHTPNQKTSNFNIENFYIHLQAIGYYNNIINSLLLYTIFWNRLLFDRSDGPMCVICSVCRTLVFVFFETFAVMSIERFPFAFITCIWI